MKSQKNDIVHHHFNIMS